MLTLPKLFQPRNIAIFDLPEDILITILVLLIHNDFRDFRRVTSNCQPLFQLAQTPPFYKTVDFFNNYIIFSYHEIAEEFYQACLDNDNPSCLLLKGMSEFIYEGRREPEEELIKKSAETGWETGMYAWSVLVRVMYGKAEVGDRGIALTREFARRICMQIVARDRLVWDQKPSDFFLEKAGVLDIDKVHRCKCASMNSWIGWWVDGWKSPDMCEECFWTIESLAFCEIVKHNFSTWPY